MLSRRKKYLYGTVLALAGAAFIGQCIFAPAPPQAAAAPAQTPKRHTPQPASGTSAATRAREGPAAAARLQEPALEPLCRLPDVPEVRDVFCPRSLPPGPPGAAGLAAADGQPDPAAAFQQAHRLQATFLEGREVVAVVDRQILRKGQVLDGFALADVTPFRAVFRRNDLEVVLDIPADDLRPKTQAARQGPETQPETR